MKIKKKIFIILFLSLIFYSRSFGTGIDYNSLNNIKASVLNEINNEKTKYQVIDTGSETNENFDEKSNSGIIKSLDITGTGNVEVFDNADKKENNNSGTGNVEVFDNADKKENNNSGIINSSGNIGTGNIELGDNVNEKINKIENEIKKDINKEDSKKKIKVKTPRDMVNDALGEDEEEKKEIEGKIKRIEEMIEKDNKENELINNYIKIKNDEVNTSEEKVKKLEEELLEKENELEKLNKKIDIDDKEIKKLKNTISNFNKQINNYKTNINNTNEEIGRYKNLEQDLAKEKFQKETLLDYYSKLKISIDEKNNKSLLKKIETYLIFVLIFFITWIILYFIFLKKNLNLYKIYTNVIFSFSFFISLIILFFYIKPEALIYLIFVASALILVFKDIILSFMCSILLLYKYKPGDIIELETDGIIGRITTIGLTSTDLLCLDNKYNYKHQKIKIPNSVFLLNKIKIINPTGIISDSISFFLKKGLNKEDIYSDIEKILYKNVGYTLKNMSSMENLKFKKILKIKESKALVTYYWNDTIENSYKIKDNLFDILLEYDAIDDSQKSDD